VLHWEVNITENAVIVSGPGPAIQQYGEWDEEIEDGEQVQRVQT